MTHEYVETTIQPSKQINEYLSSSARNKNKHQRLSFDKIMSNFIGQFVIDVPVRAEIFINNEVARSAYGLLKQAAVLLENYFPNIEFEEYLQVCVANFFHSRRVCGLLRDNYPTNKKEMFELFTEVICHSLAIFDCDLSAEVMLKYLLDAQWYFSELNLINVNQRQRAKGSRADTLNKLIFEIVEKNPKITVKELLKELSDYNIIEEITETHIYFIQLKGKQAKPAPISGLKDRLHRTVTKIQQRCQK